MKPGSIHLFLGWYLWYDWKFTRLCLLITKTVQSIRGSNFQKHHRLAKFIDNEIRELHPNTFNSEGSFFKREILRGWLYYWW